MSTESIEEIFVCPVNLGYLVGDKGMKSKLIFFFANVQLSLSSTLSSITKVRILGVNFYESLSRTKRSIHGRISGAKAMPLLFGVKVGKGGKRGKSRNKK